MSSPGRIANLYLKTDDLWLVDEIEKFAFAHNISKTEGFMRMIEEGMACLRTFVGDDMRESLHAERLGKKSRPSWM